jgi:hypothetical protein
MTIGRLSRIAVGLVFVPSLAMAQRTGGMGGGGRGMGGGGGRGGKGGGIARDEGLAIPKLVNGVNLLIEHRQEMTLSDTQFVRIIAIKRALDSTNAPLMRKLDSVQHLFKGGSIVFGDASPERRDSLTQAHGLIVDTQGRVRDNISDFREKAFALLSVMQQAKAHELEDKAEKAIAEEQKEKGRGRGG